MTFKSLPPDITELSVDDFTAAIKGANVDPEDLRAVDLILQRRISTQEDKLETLRLLRKTLGSRLADFAPASAA